MSGDDLGEVRDFSKKMDSPPLPRELYLVFEARNGEVDCFPTYERAKEWARDLARDMECHRENIYVYEAEDILVYRLHAVVDPETREIRPLEGEE